MSNDVVWEPYGYYRTHSNIARFMDDYGYDSYDDLRPESEAELARFWGAVMEDVGIVWAEEYDEVLDTSDGIAYADWFVGGKLNATETLLDKWVKRTPEKPAYVWENEAGDRAQITYAELDERTNQLANAFRDLGVEPGDAVGIVSPLNPKAFVAALACLRIGAVQTHIFAGYGTGAIRDRLTDAEAKVVVTADGYRREGSHVDLHEKVCEAVADISALEYVLTYENTGVDRGQAPVTEREWAHLVAEYSTEAETTIVDAEHPAVIAYSSGTTGKPKGTIHPHTSILATGTKQVTYQYDLRQDDTFLWVTDFGWIVVPSWLIGGAQAIGATTVLVEGSPMAPDENRLWDLVERHGVNMFGISPTGVRMLRRHNDSPRETHDLSTLRTIGSTGEPWDEETWNWYFESVGGGHLPVVNESGGTETCGGLLGVTPLTPIKPGTLWGPAPGVPANVYDEAGEPTDEGYLVVEGPVPGMTRSLTDGDERYETEYWRDYDDAWNHNDWVEIDEEGFWFIRGRADDTMNISGRRITAPTIEAVIEEHDIVTDSAVVSVPHDVKGEVPVAFVTTDVESDERKLSEAINGLISDELGPMFRLQALYVVPALPRTQTGKLPRGLIESVYLGESPGDTSTLEHGDVLTRFPTE